MSYSIIQSGAFPPTANTVTAFYDATNDRTFNIRISVANATTGTTLVGSTVLTPGQNTSGFADSTGLSPNTSYTLVMTIRRSSDFSELGTRSVTITTAGTPPPPTIWYASACCSTSGAVYASSSASQAAALDGLDQQCGGTLSNVQVVSVVGDFNSANYPAVTCAPPPAPDPSVPNVVGQTETNGRNSLLNAGFSVLTVYTSTTTQSIDRTVREYRLGSTVNPSTAPAGSQITMDVWLYSPPLPAVPNVVGETQATATSILQGQGYGVSVVTTESGADSGNTGKVKEQNPPAGQGYATGGTVTITVYNFVNRALVPDVRNQPQATATSTLQGLGFGVSISTTSNGANSGNNGNVASQDPSGGTNAVVGSTVFLTVFSFNPPVWIDNVIANTFSVGTAYSDSVSATNSPTYTISSGALPAGITLNSSTGAITGTPTTAQVYSFTIRAANSDGAVTVSYSGNTSSPPVWTDQTLGAFLQGRVYSDQVVATNSPTYSVISGSLPVGISLNSTTGAVTGTPTGSGNFSFTIRAINASGNITAAFSGTISLVPNWTDNTLGNVINGVEFSDQVVATNSPTYSVTAGSLPAGLSLNSSTGAVTGTPTGTVGTAYSFTITATNAQGTISQAFSGNVQPDLTGQISLFNGTVWAPKEVYVYDGAEWVRGQAHIFNGTAWVKSSF